MTERTTAEPSRGREPRGLPRWLDSLDGLSARRILETWLVVALASAALYYSFGSTDGHGLRNAAGPIEFGWQGLLTALYFSVVTATSIGYGDVAPLGFARVLAVTEAAVCLLLFGVLVSKLVSRKQERLLSEVHRLSFEHRVGRVVGNLNTVLGDLHVLASACDDRETDQERLASRLESTSAMFALELRAVHDLLYRPPEDPDEAVLDGILTTVANCLEELRVARSCSPSRVRTETLEIHLGRATRLAEEICSECVPVAYSELLKPRMDRVRELARTLAANA